MDIQGGGDEVGGLGDDGQRQRLLFSFGGRSAVKQMGWSSSSRWCSAVGKVGNGVAVRGMQGGGDAVGGLGDDGQRQRLLFSFGGRSAVKQMGWSSSSRWCSVTRSEGDGWAPLRWSAINGERCWRKPRQG
ncbi:hypothetical protein Dimus_020776 [Dionaea muscipula]